MRITRHLALLALSALFAVSIQAADSTVELRFHPAAVEEIHAVLGFDGAAPGFEPYRTLRTSRAQRRTVDEVQRFFRLGRLQLSGRGDAIDSTGSVARAGAVLGSHRIEVELALEENKGLFRGVGARGVTVDLPLEEIGAFLGLNADRELVRVDASEAAAFLMDPANPTICGNRKLVAYGTTELPDGSESAAAIGIDWIAGDSMLKAGTVQQATNGSCPFFSWQSGCDSSSCTFTITIGGIYTATYRGYCVPNYAALPLLCICSPIDFNPWYALSSEEAVDSAP